MRDDNFLKMKTIRDYFSNPLLANELIENPDMDFSPKALSSKDHKKILFVAKIQHQRSMPVFNKRKKLKIE
jgi:hypothetical protein